MLVAVLALALAAPQPAGLTIRVWPQGRPQPERVWTLRCAPTGGTLPRRGTACRRLATLPAPFASTPPGTMCSQIYSGPQEALVTGTFRGHRVWTRFNRRDSCATDRWNRVAFLFRVPL